MKDIDFINEEIKKLNSAELIEDKKKINKKISNICIIVGVAILITIITIMHFNYNTKRPGNFGEILKAAEKAFMSKSYVIDEEITLYNNEEKYIFNNEITKKDDNYKITLDINDSKNDVSAGGIFFNDERVELILDDEMSIFVKYTDIYNIVKTYVPQLEELCDDLEKINYIKYIKEIKKYISNFTKNFDLSDYYEIIYDNVSNNVKKDEDVTNIMIDGKIYNLEKYYIEIPARDMIKLKIELLKKIKTDKLVKKMLANINDSILVIFEKSGDYENVRMEKDELQTFKLKYSNELVSIYEEMIDKKIADLEILYSKVSSIQNETYAIYIDQYGDVRQLSTYSATLYNGECIFVKTEKQFSKVGEVKSKEIVPNQKMRVNLNLLDRSELYTSIQAVLEKRNEILSSLSENFKNYFKNNIATLTKDISQE